MIENQLSTVINNLLQQKSEEFENNEIFSLISLMTLIHIVNIFREETINDTVSSTNNFKSSPGNASLNNLLNQLNLQGNDNTNIQQLLPLLLKLLGNKNNLSQIMNLLQPDQKKQNEKDEVTQEPEKEENEDKKKTILKKRA